MIPFILILVMEELCTNIGDEVTLEQSQVCDPSCYYGVNNNVKILHNELLKLNCGSSGHPRWLHASLSMKGVPSKWFDCG